MNRASYNLVRGQVTLPGPLDEAAATGELVIFAGAGISGNTPANYLGFKGLTKKLAKDFCQPQNSGEKFDAYLGRLEKYQPRLIGELARKYFLERPRDATNAHRALVELCPVGYPVRIVTTNYDELFEIARPDLTIWSASLEVTSLTGSYIFMAGRQIAKVAS